MSDAIRLGTPPDAPIFSAATSVNSGDDDGLLCRIAAFYANQFVRDPEHYRKSFAESMSTRSGIAASKPQIASLRLMLRSLPDGLALVRDAILPPRMTAMVRQAAMVVWGSGLVEIHRDFGTNYRIPLVRQPKRRRLESPRAVDEKFGVATPPPKLDDLLEGRARVEDAAFRAMCAIMVHGWQRHCSLMRLELGDLILGGNHPELVIRYTKTGRVDQRIPVWAIFPDEEIQGLRDLERYAAGNLECSSDTRLTELAGIGRFNDQNSALAQQLFRKRLACATKYSPDITHLPRSNGLSWAPVRAIVCRHPSLLNLAMMRPLRIHPWFQLHELRKFRRIVPSLECDMVEVFRRVACWASPEQFLESYCRSWHFQHRLYAAIMNL